MTRPARPEDARAVHALFTRWAAAVDERPLTLHTFDSEWSAPGFDPDHDHWLDERDGEVVGYVALKANSGVAVRGEIAGLLPLAVARARERGDERLEVILTTRDAAGLGALESAGWTRERDVYRMWLELGSDLPEPSFPAAVRVRPYTDSDARRLHAFLELAYADNNEQIEPFDPWLHFMTQHGEFAPDFWHLAEDEHGGLAACNLTWAPYERLGWVKDLAVHPGHRRRGLGEAMLHYGARAYRDAGVERVGLKVDSDNPTRAARLYERVGYRTDRTYAILTTRP